MEDKIIQKLEHRKEDLQEKIEEEDKEHRKVMLEQRRDEVKNILRYCKKEA